jgi:hypothetical protein
MMSDGAVGPAKRLSRVRRLAADGNWVGVVDATNQIVPEEGRAILLRAVAASELDDAGVREDVVRLCRMPAVDPRIRFAVAARLVNERHTTLAWQLIADLPLDHNPQTITILRRLALNADDPAIRRGVEARLSVVSSGIAAFPVVRYEDDAFPATSIRFPEGGVAPQVSDGVLMIDAPGVAPRHQAAYRALLAEFDAEIEAATAPDVIELTDVIVNRWGQAWRPGGYIIRHANRPLPLKLAAEAEESFDDAVLCTDPTRGFYHWYAERLPSLAWRLQDGAPDLPILIGDHAGRFQEETLRLLGVPPARVRRIGDAVYCRRVLIARMKMPMLAQWSRFGWIYERLRTAAVAEAGVLAPQKAIYISRRDTARRVLVNETELEQALEQNGVVPVVLSTMTLAQQIALTAQTRLIVAPHGAGLAHCLASRPDGHIFELLPSQMGSHALRLSIARLARASGLRHTMWINPIHPLSLEWRVDIDRVLSCVAAISQSEGI